MKAILIIMIPFVMYGQDLDKDVIKKVLELQRIQNSEAVSEILYKQYIAETSYNIGDMLIGTLYSSISGASQGLYESANYGYTNIGWMPKFLQTWYNYRPNTDAVFGKVLTWQKNFREADYIADRAGYKRFNKFFAGKWYIAYPVHWVLKSTAATIFRAKMKHDNWTYDFNPEIIFALPEIKL